MVKAKKSKGKYNLKIFEKPLFAKYLMYVCVGLDSYKKIIRFSDRYESIRLHASNMSPFIKHMKEMSYVKFKTMTEVGHKGYVKGFMPNWDILIARLFSIMSEDTKRFRNGFENKKIRLEGLNNKNNKKEVLGRESDTIIDTYFETYCAQYIHYQKDHFTEKYFDKNFSKSFRYEVLVPALKDYFLEILLSYEYNNEDINNMSLDSLFRKFIEGTAYHFAINIGKKIKYPNAKEENPEDKAEYMHEETLAQESEEFVILCKEYLLLKNMLDISYYASLSLERQLKQNKLHRVERLDIPETNKGEW